MAGQKTCKIISSYLPYEGWLAVGKELASVGQYSRARQLLQEAKRHASYLASSE